MNNQELLNQIEQAVSELGGTLKHANNEALPGRIYYGFVYGLPVNGETSEKLSIALMNNGLTSGFIRHVAEPITAFEKSDPSFEPYFVYVMDSRVVKRNQSVE